MAVGDARHGGRACRRRGPAGARLEIKTWNPALSNHHGRAYEGSGMAGPTNPDKIALVAELATARSRLSETGAALRAALDVPSRAKESFRRHRPTWLGGAALLGLVLSKLPTRRKTVFV